MVDRIFFYFYGNQKFYEMRNVTFRFVFMLYYGIKYPHQFLIFAFKLTPRGDLFVKLNMG